MIFSSFLGRCFCEYERGEQKSFNSGILSFEGALEMLMTFLNIPEDKARKMLNNGVPTNAQVAKVVDE